MQQPWWFRFFARLIKRERWAVIYGNYYPREIDSLWPSRKKAEQEAARKNAEDKTSMWDVEGGW